MSYAKDVKVLCQIKAWLVVRWRGRESGRVWHQMMLGGGGGGGQGQLTLVYILREMGTRGRI